MDVPSSARGLPTANAGPHRHDADAPVGDLGVQQNQGVDVALNLIVAMAGATIRTADGVSITVGPPVDFATVAASNQKVYSMDGDQYELDEGPCLSAAKEHRRIHVPLMDEESRWPSFTARARERGIGSVLSTPLVLDEEILGALNIYASRPFAFGGDERATASAFAAQASAVLQAQARGDLSGAALGRHLQAALQARELEAFRRAALNWTSLTSDAADVTIADSSSGGSEARGNAAD